ncbi:MAG: hypothetical protein M1812_005511 [Candelaria pacifica]|nr:MAG: hypothetical protein M1812_005511 [Candelaria pacifica]
MVASSKPSVLGKGKSQSRKNDKRLSKKRKHDQVPNLPGTDVNPEGISESMVRPSSDVDTKSRKRKRTSSERGQETRDVDEHNTKIELKLSADTAVPKLGTKRTKKGQSSNSSRIDAAAALEIAGNQQAASASHNSVAVADPSQNKDGGSPKFIVFIGNLPFTATTESVAKHFAKLKPVSVRHRTHKDTGKSKGFAFLEFDGYDRMKTCLKLYHHSDFDDGISPIRKVNVELTAGGGGSKSEDRRSKLKAKNEKLNEQRKRRILEEEKVKRENANKAAGKGDDVHPSRRGRVPAS